MKNITCWVFDADDTLWESAGYFVEAEDRFAALMSTLGFPEEQVRPEIHRRDIERLALTGYGPGPYMDTLSTIMHDLVQSPPESAAIAFHEIGVGLLNHPVEPYPGVIHTLECLAGLGHRLFLYTMGQREHQLDKLEKSGLTSYFEGSIVVPRKTPQTLEALLHEFNIERSAACVVGNSPRSDIAPALHCGVNAILVKRAATWTAEQMELPWNNLVASVDRISDIRVMIQPNEQEGHGGL